MENPSLGAIPLPSLDLAQSMYAHGYELAEICRRTELSPVQVEGLAEVYGWSGETKPLYDRQIIDSGADPIGARSYFRASNGIEGRGLDGSVTSSDVQSRLSNLPAVDLPIERLEMLFQAKCVPTQHYILRAIENGTAIQTAFTIMGFDQDAWKAWVEEDPWFKASLARVLAEFGDKYLKKVEKSADADWKAAAFILQNHANTREEWGPRILDEGGGKGINITINFKRSREIPQAFIDGEVSGR